MCSLLEISGVKSPTPGLNGTPGYDANVYIIIAQKSEISSKENLKYTPHPTEQAEHENGADESVNNVLTQFTYQTALNANNSFQILILVGKFHETRNRYFSFVTAVL